VFTNVVVHVKTCVELEELEVLEELLEVTDEEVLVVELTVDTLEDVEDEDEVESEDDDDVDIGVVGVVLTETVVEDDDETDVGVVVEEDGDELLERATYAATPATTMTTTTIMARKTAAMPRF
jgi:hypothetical protein